MIKIVGVRFKKAGKIYYFDPAGLDIEINQDVIVETARGLEFGHVVVGGKEISEEELVSPLKPIIRIATEEDKKYTMKTKKRQKKHLYYVRKK